MSDRIRTGALRVVAPLALVALAATFTAGASAAVAGTAERPAAAAVQPAGHRAEPPADGDAGIVDRRSAAGHWVSAECESAGAANSITRDFSVTFSTWSVAATVFGSADCTAPLFSIINGGRYRLGAPSKVAPGAREAFFGVSVRQLTPLAQPVVDALNTQGCGGRSDWRVGFAGDVRGGCAALGLPSAAACPGEFDLLARSGMQLRFGSRPADGNMCTAERRPTALGPALDLR